jgi:hypothetical protein
MNNLKPLRFEVEGIRHQYLASSRVDYLFLNRKKRDLLSLCHELIKPLEYHYFYENLPVESKIDKLPEPDAYEEDCDSDY